MSADKAINTFVNENLICNSKYYLIVKQFTTLKNLMIMNGLMSIKELRVIKQLKDIKLSIKVVDMLKNVNSFVMMNMLKTKTTFL